MTNLTDMAAIVTGASWGIGGGIARMLAAEGVKVALAARREAERVRFLLKQGGKADFADVLRGHRLLHGSRN